MSAPKTKKNIALWERKKAPKKGVAEATTKNKLTDCKQSEKAPKKEKNKHQNTTEKQAQNHHQNHTKCLLQNR